ncbi:MAG: sulfatase-like hydrolase/transferase [Anaerolineaceae bacterium]|nr:sulfatase-like hydrolase/transferase [Anaerolineaceae bacterium]
MKIKENFKAHTSSSWLSIIITTIIVISVYLFMEWIFLATKPSFMSSLKGFDQLGIFFQSTIFTSTIYFAMIGIFILIDHWLSNFIKGTMFILGRFIPSFLTACLLLLLVDNFSYTIFQFGIVTSTGLVRAMYGLFFVILLFVSIKELSALASKIEIFINNFEKKKILTFSLIFIFILVLVGNFPVLKNIFSRNLSIENDPLKNSPHIILITADGVNAENMSLYGYERDTTPFLESLAESSLVAQNAFTNSANTSGSIISILTGKYPIDTKVLYPPDILKSVDAYQHLPAILKLNGYTTIQYSFGHYVDAYQLNVMNGFDVANGRSYQSNILRKINNYLPDNLGFFLYEIGNRIVDRIRHIFFLKQMSNPLKEVSSPDNYKDMYKIDSVLNFIDNSTKPVFSHIHWMGTHGARFYPREQVFSAGQDPAYQNDWELDFYDDSILNFDQSMKILYLELENRGILDNSIIIIASDHGQRFTTDKRLPLIIRFPNGEFKNYIQPNIQNLDIPPTILDYLGISIPNWMAGDSLLNDIPDNKQIFAVGVGNVEIDEGSVVLQSIKPPFFQFGYVTVINCATWYKLDLSVLSWEEHEVPAYKGNCTNQQLDKNQVLDKIIDFFNAYEYDTSLLFVLYE